MKKNTIKKIVIGSSVISIIILGIFGIDSYLDYVDSNQPGVIDEPTAGDLESRVDINQFKKTIARGNRMSERFKNRFFAISSQSEVKSFENLNCTELVSLDAIQRFIDSHFPIVENRGQSILGLGIYYGLDAEYRPIFYYQPLLLNGVIKDEDTRAPLKIEKYNIFQYSSTSQDFVPVTDNSTYNDNVNRYSSSIWKKNWLGNYVDVIIDSNDPNSDPAGIYFPLVQLTKLIEHNKEALLSYYQNKASTLNIHPLYITAVSINYMVHRSFLLGEVFHSAIFVPVLNQDPPPDAEKVLRGMAANMGHLCPPNCDQIELDIKAVN